MNHPELDELPAFVLALDAQGRIVFWNRLLEHASGFSRDEMLGRPGADFVAAGVRHLAMKGGGQLVVRWKRSAAPGPDGVTYAVGCDVTGEEEALRRTLRSERLAAVETLVAGLAHELRNPLNSASLQLQVLRRRLARPEGGSESLEPILTSVDEEIARLERLVNDFLSFVQPRPLALRRMEVEELFKGVLAGVEPEANAAGIATSFDVQPDLPVVHSDPERLRHVLQHLVRNAVEAMPAGGQLALRARRTADDRMVEIDVADTGKGFSEQAPIFDAFFTTKPNGTGLGLAIVHRIVSDHGGTIHVRSKPGDTCFTIALPTRTP